MKKIIIIVIVIAAAVGLIIFASRNNNQDSSQESQVFDKAPDFSLKDYSGNTVKLGDFQGRPLVINSWAAWCPFCAKELQDFVAIQKEFQDQVIIIAVDRPEPAEVAKSFTDKLGITADLVFLLDPSDFFYRSIGGFSMPETIFVDKDGNIVDHKRGPMDLEEIRERIKKIID